MSRRKLSVFMRELEDEARAEGPAAVEELETFREHFRLAHELADARRRQGLTQRQLAERTGVNQSEISDIERGQANPTFGTLQRLANGLGHRFALVRVVGRPVRRRRAS